MRAARVLALVALAATPAAAAELTLIDTHAHLDHAGNLGNLSYTMDSALATMDRLGIRLSIVEPPPQVSGLPVTYDCDRMKFVARDGKGRFRINGGGGRINAFIQETASDDVTDRMKARFRERVDEVLGCGIVGFGEIAAHHMSMAQMGERHPYEWTPPDHPLLLMLADIAAEKDIPIDLHLDLVPEDMPLPNRPIFNATNPRTLKANLAGFERLLDHNKAARIIWAHAGSDPLQTKTPEVLRALMTRHANLYASIRPGMRGGPPPVAIFDGQLRIKGPWLALLRDFPDRFVLGSDQFHPPSSAMRRTPPEGIENLVKLVDQLPPELARAVGSENANRLFKLAP